MTAEPVWLGLRAARKTVVAATFPGADGIDVRVSGPTSPIVQPAAERTVDYTVPFGAFGGLSARGFSLTAADFGPAPATTRDQGREPNGTVPREEYVVLQQQIAQALRELVDENPNYTNGQAKVPVFDKIYSRPLPPNIADPSFGRGTDQFIAQDSGDVFAMLTVGYNFDGTQNPAVLRLGDPASASPILSLPNFYGAHGYDPTLPNLSAIFMAAGPDIRRGTLTLVNSIDVAPTAARLPGVKLSTLVDGHALPVRIPRQVLTSAASSSSTAAMPLAIPLITSTRSVSPGGLWSEGSPSSPRAGIARPSINTARPGGWPGRLTPRRPEAADRATARAKSCLRIPDSGQLRPLCGRPMAVPVARPPPAMGDAKAPHAPLIVSPAALMVPSGPSPTPGIVLDVLRPVDHHARPGRPHARPAGDRGGGLAGG